MNRGRPRQIPVPDGFGLVFTLDDRNPHDVEVWLDPDGGEPLSGIVVGHGGTLPLALDDARKRLARAAVRLEDLSYHPQES